MIALLWTRALLSALLAANASTSASDATATTLTHAEQVTAARITAGSIAARLRFLADDLFEGRETGTRGDAMAAKYLASELEALGIEPGAPADKPADRSYFQPVPIVELTAQVPESISFAPSAAPNAAAGTPLSLSTRNGEKAELVLFPDAHVDRAAADKAELVFVGYGISAPQYDWDDYKDVDVKGKIVVLLNFNPPFAGAVAGKKVRLWYGRWDYKYSNAASHGALGALIVHTDESAGYPWRVLAGNAGPTAQRLDLPPEPNEARLQFRGWLQSDAAARLIAHGGQSLEKLTAAAQSKSFRATPLGLNTSFVLPIARRKIQGTNVIGLLRGNDAKLREEAVVYTAHHDHLGMVTPVPPATDGVYNGALDNASGCAALLSIARAATSANTPRRSMLFVLTTGEEEGLLGARWFAAHPTFPVGRLTADINLDVINVWGRTKDVTVLGLGKSSLDDIVRAVAQAQHRTIHGDSSPDKGQFYRSDHFALASVGVPVAAIVGGPDYQDRPAGWGQTQLDTWISTNYHQVSDEFHADWDLSGAVEDAQLQLIVGLRAANAPELQKWTPGDEFEAARELAPR